MLCNVYPCDGSSESRPPISNIRSEFRILEISLGLTPRPNSPTKFGVRGVPTVMIFKNGQLKGTKVGSVPESTMKAWLTENA